MEFSLEFRQIFDLIRDFVGFLQIFDLMSDFVRFL